MKTSSIRKSFIEFFKNKNHKFIPGASTIAIGDKTILFNIAGMTQFKPCLLGEEKRAYTRATNAQKCIRVLDLDDVGKDGRHLTMFEMLGSWSFGDYYKKEAIEWAFEFSTKILKLDVSKIWISVYKDDDESYNLWQKFIPKDRIRKLGDEDNFWAMGPTGPCGPCSEMYYDQGESFGKCHDKGFSCLAGPGCDCDRYLEYWNLVFMQYNRDKDQKLSPLPMKSVDTGAGLERISALVNKKDSAFAIDIFESIIKKTLALAHIEKDIKSVTAKQRESIYVIADHIRLLCFTLADGVTFSNEGRGYVLRRVLRRAVRHVKRLAPNWPKNKSFLKDIVPAVTDELGDFYTELKDHESKIIEAISHEELKFQITLDEGLKKFDDFLLLSKKNNTNVFSGEYAFLLHDRYGFPLDLTQKLCEERNLNVDSIEFDSLMKKQKEKSRHEAKFYLNDESDAKWIELFPTNNPSENSFSGYDLKSCPRNPTFFKKDIEATQISKFRILENKRIEVVIKDTPFYPEGGGQISDKGLLVIEKQDSSLKLNVEHAEKNHGQIVHLMKSHDALTEKEFQDILSSPNIRIYALISKEKRLSTARNHTATHLLHASLKKILGDNVRQAGSLVSVESLRFDFTYHEKLSDEQISAVEHLVNKTILENSQVLTKKDVPLEDAKKMGAEAIFDEKYDDKVRVLEIPGFSIELCGGTHVTRTGDIGYFKIISEASVTSGVRRIEAVTGEYVSNYIQTRNNILNSILTLTKSNTKTVLNKITQIQENSKELQEKIKSLESQFVALKFAEIKKLSYKINGVHVLIEDISSFKFTHSQIEKISDTLKGLPKYIVLFANILENNKVSLTSVVSKDLLSKPDISASEIVKEASLLLDGKGGGRRDFAKGAGKNSHNLKDVLIKIKESVNKRLS